MFTLHNSDQTVGQQLLGIKYGGQGGPAGSSPDQWVSGRQKGALAALAIACPWLRERLGPVLTALRLSACQQQLERCLRWAETLMKVASLVNLLVFLRQGAYHSVTERLVGVRAFFPQRQSVRQVSFDFMTRELLWHGFSELLLFLLPLVSVQRVKNTVLRWVAPGSNPSQRGPQARSRADLMACVVCGDWPVHPHQVGCCHVFCHYCIASNLKADPGYLCPLCGSGDTTASGVLSPQPVRPTVGPENR